MFGDLGALARNAASGINRSITATPGIAPSAVRDGGGFFNSDFARLVGDGFGGVLTNATRAGFDSVNRRVGGGQPLPDGIGVAARTDGQNVRAYAFPVGVAVAAMLGVVLLFRLIK